MVLLFRCIRAKLNSLYCFSARICKIRSARHNFRIFFPVEHFRHIPIGVLLIFFFTKIMSRKYLCILAIGIGFFVMMYSKSVRDSTGEFCHVMAWSITPCMMPRSCFRTIFPQKWPIHTVASCSSRWPLLPSHSGGSYWFRWEFVAGVVPIWCRLALSSDLCSPIDGDVYRRATTFTRGHGGCLMIIHDYFTRSTGKLSMQICRNPFVNNPTNYKLQFL